MTCRLFGSNGAPFSVTLRSASSLAWLARTLESPVQMGCGAGPWPAAVSQAALAGLRAPRSLRGCPTPRLATFIKFLVPKARENTLRAGLPA